VCAAVSHLPHLLAFAYINGLADQTRLAQFLALAGPGFRDFTRIAGAHPDMWRDVYLSNREAIRDQLNQFKAALGRFEQALDEQDAAALAAFVARSRDVRAPWQLNAAIPKRDDLTQQ
jgi:prephenate dehydrogenase